MPRLSSLMLLLTAFLLGLHAAAVTVVINEFQASNGETIADEDGDFEDWIELYNYGEEPVLLGGYGLSDDEDRPFRWVLPDIALGPGKFLLIFASNKDRTDGVLHTNYAISSAGEEVLLTAPDGTLLDFVPPTPIPRDVSYGRKPDGTGEWYFFDEPTPGTENTTENFLGVLDPPEFSHEGGFYEEPFDLVVTHHDPAVTLRYTLDGNVPGNMAPVLNGPLSIQDRSEEPDEISLIPTTIWTSVSRWLEPHGPVFKGTPVRVQAHHEDWLPSPTVTRTYFVTPEGTERYDLPVISLVTAPENFFSGAKGIYVPGDGYDGEHSHTMNPFRRGREWERPVHMELVEADGSFGFAQDLGARIHGAGSRIYAQKSLRLYARNAYAGTNVVEYPLMSGARMADGSQTTTFRRFLLRQSGTDYFYSPSMLRDLFMQSLLFDSKRMETQGGRPSAVFVNGEFWGLFNIRERYDPHYISVKYGLDPGRISILERDAWRSSATLAAKNDYLALREYAVENDLSDAMHYKYVVDRMDPQSKIEHWAANIYFHNTDWPHNNIDFWRYERAGDELDDPDTWWLDGRWRWMLFDTDLGFNLRGPFRPSFNAAHIRAFEEEHGTLVGPSANTLKWTTHEINLNTLLAWPNELFRALLENEGFRQQLISHMADLLNANFREEHALAELEKARGRIESIMPEQIARWRQADLSMSTWEQNINRMRTFAVQRPGHVRQHVVDEFDLEGTYELRIQMPPEGSARVRVNSIELEADGEEWTGIYFLGVPIEVEVMPEFLHEFIGWEGAFEGEGNLLELTPGSDLTLAPIVKDDGVTLTEVVLPRFMQGESPNNDDRVPFSCRLRIEGLLPNAVYRYANRVLSPDDPPTQNGAGNAIYYDFAAETHWRTTDTPDFSEPGTYGEFITDENGVYEGWFTLEPSGNQRFEEPELFIRILLNDGLGGEEYHHFIKTDNTVRILPFGFGWEEATGLYATSPLTPGEVVVLHDDIDGSGRPLTATLIEDAGFEVDDRYATFYEQFVTGLDGHFGTLLPNLLPDGLQRIEAFDWFTAESTAVYTRQDGFWPDNADTVNPDGGLGFPFVLNLGEPDTDRLPGDVNRDGVVNAVDVQLVINAALGIEIDPSYQPDINEDGVVNAVDVQLVINAALRIPIQT